MMDKLIYDTHSAFNDGVRQHPKLDVISLGMKAISYRLVSMADMAVIEVEKAINNLPSYIRIEND